MGTLALAPARCLHLLRRPLAPEICLYLIASVVDVILTYVLLYGDGPWIIVESNPVARWVLERYGFPGMVVFKTFFVAMVTASCLTIAMTRPLLAQKVLRFADLAVSCVVGYSLYLLWQFA